MNVVIKWSLWTSCDNFKSIPRTPIGHMPPLKGQSVPGMEGHRTRTISSRRAKSCSCRSKAQGTECGSFKEYGPPHNNIIHDIKFKILLLFPRPFHIPPQLHLQERNDRSLSTTTIIIWTERIKINQLTLYIEISSEK